jgi:hypothetical protein
MAQGGKRPGSGRKKGKALKISEYFSPAEVAAFVADLKETAKTDSRVKIWLGDHLFGKAPQPVTGPEGGALTISFDKSFDGAS